MEKFFQENIISLGLGLILSSLALFGAFKAGQALERKITLDSIHEFSFITLKQKTATKLEMLLNEYKESHANISIPNNINYNEIVEHFVGIDQTILEKSLGLNQIYLNLICNDTQSVYFSEFLHYLMLM